MTDTIWTSTTPGVYVAEVSELSNSIMWDPVTKIVKTPVGSFYFSQFTPLKDEEGEITHWILQTNYNTIEVYND